MRFRALRVRNVGPFGEQGCALEGLSDGLNVIRERNEAGKSTLFTALQTVLFEKHSSNKSALKEFRHDRGGGAPFIELDLEVDGRVYRISKQYLSAASAVVTDVLTGERLSEKRDAENWIKELIGGDNPDDGPSGMLWIRQGDPYLQPNPEGRASEALFSVLEGEVDTVMGGQRATRVLGRAEKRLAEIVSTTRMTPKGAFKEAMSRLKELEQERANHSSAARQSESDRENLVSVLSELERLTTEEDDKLAQDIAVARKKLEAAEGASEKIHGLRSEASAHEMNLEAAEGEVARYNADLESAKNLRKKILDKQTDVERVRENIEERETLLSGLREKVNAATVTYEQAKKAHQEAQAREKRRQGILQRKSLGNALGRAREIVLQLKTAETTVIAELPELSALEKANQDILTFEAQARTTRPTLTVKKSGAPVLLNGEAIGDVSQVRLSGRTKVSYQDLELTIETPDAQGSEEKLAKAKRELRDLLEACGAKDINSARRAHELRNAAREAVERLKTDLKAYAPEGITMLENQLAVLPGADEEEGEPEDLDALTRTADLAKEELVRIESERDVASGGIVKQQQQLIILETQVEGFENQLKDLDEALGQDAEREERKTKLNDADIGARRRWRAAHDRD